MIGEDGHIVTEDGTTLRTKDICYWHFLPLLAGLLGLALAELLRRKKKYTWNKLTLALTVIIESL